MVQDKMPGDMCISYSREECIEDDKTQIYNKDFLDKVNASSLPPHYLPPQEKILLH